MNKMKLIRKQQKVLKYLSNLEKRARKLRKELDEYNVARITRGELGLSDSPISWEEMPKKFKKKILRSTKYSLTSMANSFDLWQVGISKFPDLWWEKKIIEKGGKRRTIKGLKEMAKKFESHLNLIEKTSVKLFRRKNKEQ